LNDGFEDVVQAWLSCASFCTGAQGDVAHFKRDSAGRRVDGDDGAGVGERDVGLLRIPAALGALGALEFGLRSALRRSRVGGAPLLRSGLLLGLWGVRSSCALAAARDGGTDAGVVELLGAVLAVLGAPMVGLRSALGELRSGLLLGLWGVRSSCALAAARDGVSDAGVGALLGAVLAVLAVRVLLAVQAVQVLLAVLTLLVGMSSSGRCRDTAMPKRHQNGGAQ
jgi:hypothetical protein